MLTAVSKEFSAYFRRNPRQLNANCCHSICTSKQKKTFGNAAELRNTYVELVNDYKLLQVLFDCNVVKIRLSYQAIDAASIIAVPHNVSSVTNNYARKFCVDQNHRLQAQPYTRQQRA
jgi:hypothetical protein